MNKRFCSDKGFSLKEIKIMLKGIFIDYIRLVFFSDSVNILIIPVNYKIGIFVPIINKLFKGYACAFFIFLKNSFHKEEQFFALLLRQKNGKTKGDNLLKPFNKLIRCIKGPYINIKIIAYRLTENCNSIRFLIMKHSASESEEH